MKGLGPIILVVLAISQIDAKDYHIFTSPQLNWAGAVADCLDRGMRLATVTSASEQKRLEKAIALKDLQYEALWLSGSELGVKGTYVWMSTGKPLGYTNWRVNQPDHDVDEHCLGIWPLNGMAVWNDFRCSVVQSYVCETKPKCCSEKQPKAPRA